ncbi:MAG: hypothetical protein MUE53_07870, partial [Chitinophagales bacterium]|nr:hypothetical protein [Chitinophagales bacterium]
MNKLIVLLITLLSIGISNIGLAQVKIGSNPNTINSNAILELESSDKGIILPRVRLTSVFDSVTVGRHTEGMYVYNLNQRGTDSTRVVPGIYFNNGFRWVRVLDLFYDQTVGSINVADPIIVIDNTTGVVTKDFKVSINREQIVNLVADSIFRNQKFRDSLGQNTVTKDNITKLLQDSTKNVIVFDPASGILTSTVNGKVSTTTISGTGGGGTLVDNVTNRTLINNILKDSTTNQMTFNNATGVLISNVNGKTTQVTLPTSTGGGSNTFSNGLTNTSGAVTLGGTLTQPTIITANGSNTLSIQGLNQGTKNDSVMVVDASSGVVKRVGKEVLGAMVSESIIFRDSVKSIVSKDVTIVKDLRDSVLSSKSFRDSTAKILRDSTINTLTFNNSTGVLISNVNGKTAQVTLPTSTGGGTNTFSNGLTNTSGAVTLGGNLTQPTNITTSATNTLSVSGLTAGTTTDEIVVVDASGVMKKVPQSTVGGVSTATNGLTKNGTAVELGGPLTKPTTIGTDATNTLTLNGTGLNITSLGSGSVNDSLVVVDPTSGKLKRVSPSAVGEKLTATNGLTKNGTALELGGTLTRPTLLTTSPTNTLSVAGLTTGTTTDEIVVVDASGVV